MSHINVESGTGVSQPLAWQLDVAAAVVIREVPLNVGSGYRDCAQSPMLLSYTAAAGCSRCVER